MRDGRISDLLETQLKQTNNRYSQPLSLMYVPELAQ